MNWWRVANDQGHAIWNANALEYGTPGVDTVENHYIGTEVVEWTYFALELISDHVKNCHSEWIKEFFMRPTDIPHDDKVAAAEILSRIRTAIDQVYMRDWQRLPHQEELIALFSFCQPFNEAHA